MLKPVILLLEPDAGAEKLLTDALMGAGFDVLSVQSTDAVLAAVHARQVTALVMDVFLPNFDVPGFVRTLAQSRPDTAIVCTAEQPGLSLVLGVMRAGASDFMAKPFSATDALERIRTAVARRRAERNDLKELQSRLQSYERQTAVLNQQLAELNQRASSQGGPANSAVVASASAFAELALQTFTMLEKEHLDIIRRSLATEDPTAAARLAAHARTFIAHHDPDFVRGVIKRGEQLQLEFKAPLATGGEILDKIGHTPGEVLIIGDQLPDIPAQMVVETIQSQHPDVSIVYIENWATPNQSVTLLSGLNPQPIARLMRNVTDLVSVLESARERSQEALFSREFTDRFRTKHDAFLSKYRELIQLLGRR